MGSKSHSGLPRIFHILNSETFLKDMDHKNSKTISPLTAWKGLPKKPWIFFVFFFQLDEFLRIQLWFHGLKITHQPRKKSPQKLWNQFRIHHSFDLTALHYQVWTWQGTYSRDAIVNNVFFGQFLAWNDETLESNHHVVQYDPFFPKMVCLLRKSMKAFTFQLVLCVVEVACLKIIGRITQRLNAKNVEESGCGSDKRHEKIYISFFFWVENSSFLFWCLLFVEWVKRRCGHLEKV